MLAGTGEAVHLQKTGEKSVPLRGHGCLMSDEVTRLGLGDSLAIYIGETDSSSSSRPPLVGPGAGGRKEESGSRGLSADCFHDLFPAILHKYSVSAHVFM